MNLALDPSFFFLETLTRPYSQTLCTYYYTSLQKDILSICISLGLYRHREMLNLLSIAPVVQFV